MEAVSILIPTYNQAHYIGRAIRSALDQDYKKLDVVVSDDNSTDETEKVVETSYRDRRLRYFRNNRNLGRVGNYKKALYTYATGDWVLVLDGDDYLVDSSFVSSAMEEVGSHDKVVAVIGGQRSFEVTSECRDLVPTQKSVEVIDGQRFFLDWDTQSVVPHLGVVYRRYLALDLDFYRYDILSTDWESLRRLVLNGNVVLLGRIVGAWHAHGGNASRNLSYDKCAKNLLSITKPYEYAIELGLAGRRLDLWFGRNISQFVLKYIPELVYAGKISDAMGFVQFMRTQFPREAKRGLLTLMRDFRFVVKLFTVTLGGVPLLDVTVRNYHRIVKG